jgi:hypothetical protein
LTRMVLRTHQSASRPIHLVLLCCVYGGDDPPRNLARLRRRLLEEAGSETPYPMERSAPTFYAEWARAMGLLTRGWSLTGRGKAVAWLGCRTPTRAPKEVPPDVAAILLKYYLEADGALMLRLLRIVYERELDQAEFTRDDSVEQTILDVLNSYLSLEPNLRERTRLKQQIRTVENRGRGYKRETRPHKIGPHLIPLVDFGLISREMTATGSHFFATRPQRARIGPFLTAIQSVEDLEESVHSSSLTGLVGRLLGTRDKQALEIGPALAEAYEAVSEEVGGLAELATLRDAIWAWSIGREVLLSPSTIDEFIQERVHAMPRLMKFHVDRRGDVAFIVIDDAARQELARGG